jgi:hypothetical protein
MENIKWYVLLIGVGVAILGFVFVVQGLLARKKAVAIKGALAASAGQVSGLPEGSWVKLAGQAVSQEPLVAPGSGRPCLYYHHKVEQVRRTYSGDARHPLDAEKEWYTVVENERQAPFYVRDATGDILVLPDGAKFETLETFFDEPGSLGYEPAPGDSEPGVVDRVLDSFDILEEDTGSYRTSEEIVPVGAPVVVYGSLHHTPGGSQVSKGEGDMLVSHKTEEQLLKEQGSHMKLGLIIGGVMFVGGIVAVIYSLQFIS